MENLIHLANLLILGSFLVRDILWLRVLSILGGLAFIGYFGFAIEQPLMAPVYWNSLFTVINLYQIGRLLAERRPVFLDEREQRLHQLAFQGLSPRELTRLLAAGQWQNRSDVLVASGSTPDRLMLLCDGTANVHADDTHLASLGAGQFVGEMAWLTGDAATAEVRADGDVELMSWPFAGLKQLLHEQPGLNAAVQRHLGSDLAAKLRAPRHGG